MANISLELYFWIPYAILMVWFLYIGIKHLEKKDK